MEMCCEFFIMELVPHWWLLLFVSATAENQPFYAYNFTLESYMNGCMWKIINQTKQKNINDKITIAQNFPRQYTNGHEHFSRLI
jgi:hypothetical protein